MEQLTINDLKLSGMVLGWLVIDTLVTDLQYQHIGFFCDNTSAVTWLHKGSTTTSPIAAALLRFLHVRIQTRQASSFIPELIKGDNNGMADVSSHHFEAHKSLTTYFDSNFPQSTSWLEYTIPSAWVMQVMSCLCGMPLPMASLLRLPKIDTSISNTGAITAAISKCNQISNMFPKSKPSLQQQCSVLQSGAATTVM